jgi:hypothetical protein
MPSFTIITNPSEIALSTTWIPSTKFNSKDRVVNAEGKAVGADYKGRQYRIIEKRECIFSTSERIGRGFLGTLAVVCTLCIGRGFLGTLAVVCTLFLGLFSKSVRNLFIKPKENVRFGVLVSPSSNLPSPIASSISISSPPSSQGKVDPVKVKTHQVPLTVSPQKPKHVEPSLPIDISSYEALKKEMKQKRATLYVTDETGKHPETLLGVLGRGGSKKAIQVARGRALILPNMDADPTAHIAGRWERMVLEEVKMSKILSRLGLLSPLSEQVSVALTESSENVIPAYISESFENLSLKGCFIIDIKNSDSSTWKEGEHSLFQSDEERLSEKNWDSVFDSALTDISKICSYNIPAEGDSLNIAIVKKASDSAVCQHEVRYFGFDFSSKRKFLAIPDAENRSSTPPNIDKATQLLNSIIENVFFCEFGQRYLYGAESENLRNLKDRLVQRYIKGVAARMSS